MGPTSFQQGPIVQIRQIACVLVASLWVWAAHAADPAAVLVSCPDKYVALAHTPRPKNYPAALEVAGIGLALGQPLPRAQKEDGIYIYLVVRQGHYQALIWSLRAPGETAEEPGKNLATHDSLYKKAIKDFGHGVEVIAAGQAVLANNQVARIDNRSFTRRGDATRLGVGEEALKAAGLKFVDEGNVHTQRIDFNQANNPDWDHQATAEEIANLRARQDADPYVKMSGELIRAYQHSIYERFPQFRHPTIPGLIDEARIFDPERLFPDGKMSSDDKMALLETKDIFRLLQREGVEVANRYLLTPEFDKFGSAPSVTRVDRFRRILTRAMEMQP